MMSSDRAIDPLHSDSMERLRLALRQFADERDWHQFHSPKNLAMALSGETGELVALFQWLTEEASGKLDAETRLAVAHEMADVLLYLTRLADVLDIDLLAACRDKMAINAKRYPVASSRGRADKYDSL